MQFVVVQDFFGHRELCVCFLEEFRLLCRGVCGWVVSAGLCLAKWKLDGRRTGLYLWGGVLLHRGGCLEITRALVT